MDTLAVAVAVTSALTFTGLLLIVRPWLPATPALRATVRRLHTPAANPAGAPGARTPGPEGSGLLRKVLPVPHADLALLGKTERQYLTQMTLAGLLGLAFPVLVTGLTIVVGKPLPFVIPVLAALFFAGVFMFTVHRELTAKAKRAQREFRRAVEAYLDLIAMERASGMATIAAMERAAAASDIWVFQRIRDALHRAQLQMRPPWQELQEVAAQIRVPELGDVGKIMETSGLQGASVHESLLARADALSDLDRTEKLAEAKGVSSKLDAPAALMLLLISAVLLITILARIGQPQ